MKPNLEMTTMGKLLIEQQKGGRGRFKRWPLNRGLISPYSFSAIISGFWWLAAYYEVATLKMEVQPTEYRAGW